WNKGDYIARCIQKCEDCYIEAEELFSYKQEKHKKVTNLLDNKVFLNEYQEWL
ncbi:9339_t:CDS:1, partial [Cetraspora pellucida]